MEAGFLFCKCKFFVKDLLLCIFRKPLNRIVLVKLSEISTLPPEHLDKDEIEKETELLYKKLTKLQHLLYAEQKHSVLVVLQGMDASGKDGVTRNVFGVCSPTGILVKAFKKPSEEEFAHDFLWRVHQHAPSKGMIQVFNRSHYEDVLIQRVHSWITEERAMKRIQSINAFEDLLAYDNNTLILKFYLHVSRADQKKELEERITDPDKQWKHNANDWKEAELWDEYMRCYEDLFTKCTIPWHIIPADKKWYRDYCIAKVAVGELEKLEMKFPKMSEEDLKMISNQKN